MERDGRNTARHYALCRLLAQQTLGLGWRATIWWHEASIRCSFGACVPLCENRLRYGGVDSVT